MTEGKIKIFIYGDASTPTGFARVLHSIQSELPEEEYETVWLGINYRGDPHKFSFKLYPAILGGDMYGYGRIKDLLEKERPDILFILNDAWVIAHTLHIIKDLKILPKIIVYFPVDATGFDRNWFNDYGIVTKAFTYTEFGKKVVEDSGANINVGVIPHGVDTKTFFKITDRPREDLRRGLFGKENVEAINSFIFLNANRNQPRKRIDIFLEAFKLFSEGKTEPIRAYCHMGLRDAGWDINRLSIRYGLVKKVLASVDTPHMQYVSDDMLNIIYNVSDVGVNTSTGEGWGLVNVEHACTGAPQIVGDHSACHELFRDCGLLVPPKLHLVTPAEGVVHQYLSAEDVATAMNKIYYDRDLYKTLSEKAYNKFTDSKYTWKTITKTWDNVFKEAVSL